MLAGDAREVEEQPPASRQRPVRVRTYRMTYAEYRRALARDEGLCLACGHAPGAVDPDAEACACDACGEPSVCGLERARELARLDVRA